MPDGAPYQRFDEKPYESKYFIIDTVIDHPPEAVWPHASNIGSWMSDHRLVTLEGEPGSVGHFERVYADVGDDVPEPRSHVYGVAQLVPPTYIGLEVFSEKGGSYGDPREFLSFDTILLTDIGGKTKLTFLVLEVRPGEQPPISEQTREIEETFRASYEDRARRYFENLSRVVEAAQAAAPA
jgi:hypothetical protein